MQDMHFLFNKGERLMKKFSIGYRTLKTALGASIAIAVAQFFDLQFYTAAGILTILSVQPTKKKSLHAVYTRVISSIVGIALAYFFFGIFGYNAIVIRNYAVVFYPNNCIARCIRRICFKCGNYYAYLFAGKFHSRSFI